MIGHQENINNEIDWSIENQSAARKYFQNIFKNAVMEENYNFNLNLSSIGEEKVKIVEDCFNIRKSEILNKLQCDILCKLDVPLVTGFDWRLKWLIGSSSLSSIREPIAQLDLYTLNNKDDSFKKNLVNFEMNLSEIDNLINKLESAINNLND